MTEGLKKRKARSGHSGRFVEQKYRRIFPDIEPSSLSEDRFKHIDFWHGSDGVDVKGNNFPESIWIEFKNVQGHLGWLFGEARWIAFDVPELAGFVRVERQELVDWCKENVDYQVLASKGDCYRKGYQRDGRKDLITKICLADLQELSSCELLLYELNYKHPLTGEEINVGENKLS